MHHRMRPSKTGHFKRGDFSTCDVPCSGGPKTVTTPEIIDQIQQLILKVIDVGIRLGAWFCS